MRLQLLLLMLLAVTVCYAQSEREFTSGLAVGRSHHYGREAVATDRIAFLMHTNQLKTPKEGAVIFTDEEGNAATWEKIEVDSTGKFRGLQLTDGYIYLTYHSDRAREAIINASGNSMLYFNGEPRAGDIYGDGWMYLPVKLKKGINEIMIRCGRFSRWQGVSVRLMFPQTIIALSTDDATLPHIVIGESKSELTGGVVVINNSGKAASGLMLEVSLNGKKTRTQVPNIGPNAVRKVAFNFDPTGVSEKGDYTCQMVIKQKGKVLDEKKMTIGAVRGDEHQSHTFASNIDGSVQYYGVAPGSSEAKNRPALFLSVHGAGVEAIGQARAYQTKDWGVLVAPTNRRPRGFNWEDWGRLDALEVFELAKQKFNPDPERIYLTGHSMGGHGTWYLGATYPDKWAAIAPCAGYPTLAAYGSADGRIPDSARSPMETILLRASNQSDVLSLARNYKSHGVYIFHGDDDRVVPVGFARQMRDLLGDFHPDFSYYEYPGGSHWFGNESVDWPPLFEYFRWHRLKADSAIQEIDFTTANPAVSASYRWASVIQQEEPLKYSNVKLQRDLKSRTIRGTTRNVAALSLSLNDFNNGDTVFVTLDSILMHCIVKDDVQTYFFHSGDDWTPGEKVSAKEKNPRRSGAFKEAFNHRMVFVYGTAGDAREDEWTYSKARYDAETWYYRGNGSVEVIADREFDAAKYKDRGVILYGNSSNNAAWKTLLNDCPIQVTRNRIQFGTKTFEGDDLGAYFIWPRADSEIALVGVVTGTGLQGLRAAEPNQYFAGGSGFPDYMIFSVEMLQSGVGGVKAAGFYNNAWKIPEPATEL